MVASPSLSSGYHDAIMHPRNGSAHATTLRPRATPRQRGCAAALPSFARGPGPPPRPGTRASRVPSVADGQGAEQAVALVLRPCREQHLVGATLGAVAGLQRPEAVDADRLSVLTEHGPGRGESARVERVDPAVTEVSDQQVAAERSEPRRRDRQSPRRVELPVARGPVEQAP